MLPILFIVGPTATGKSQTAFLLARQFKAQIISCDSMLIYKEPQIITSKPCPEILKEVPHHFVNIVSVEDTYSVFDYFSSATKKVEELFARNIPIIVCGGSGLYVKAILDGIFEGVGRDDDLRKQLEEKARNYGKEYLHQELKKVDSETAAKVNDLRRIIRALEVYHTTGVPLSQKKKEAKGLWGNFAIKIFGLHLERKTLYERINKRVEEMFEKGAVEEVKELLKLTLSLTAQKMIGIKEIKGFLDGEYNIEEAKNLMKINTRHFAKRQRTWFRRDRRIEWVDMDSIGVEQIADTILKGIEADMRRTKRG